MDFTGLSQPLAGAQGRQAWGGGARMFCFASRFLTATQHFAHAAQSRGKPPFARGNLGSSRIEGRPPDIS